MAGIKRHMQSFEIDTLATHRLNRMVDIDLARIFYFDGRTDLVANRHLNIFAIGFLASNTPLNSAFGNEQLDLVFHRIGQLEPVRVEELNAIVLRRVVRSRNHNAAIGMQFPNE